ncbi:MAG: plastocyanin/azurin family copper-binding protein [Thermoanaerobaculia bacterium]
MSRAFRAHARIWMVTVGAPFLAAGALFPVTHVAVGNTFFSPAVVTIYAGEQVQWSNTGGSHNARADDDLFQCSVDCISNNGVASGGWSSTFTFDSLENATNAGPVPYYCDNHGLPGGLGMTGVVIVQRAIFSDGFEGNDELEWSAGAAAGDTCANPIVPAIPAAALAGDLRGAKNDLDLTLNASCLSASAKGRDRVYQVVVGNGNVLTATVTPVSTGFDPAIYIVDLPSPAGACAFATYSCLGSSGHVNGPGGAETATFSNTSAAPRTVLVVVDSIAAAVAGSEYTIDLSVN